MFVDLTRLPIKKVPGVLLSAGGRSCRCLCFSDGGLEEETQRGAGKRGGESQKAEQRGAGFTDSAGPTTVSSFVWQILETRNPEHDTQQQQASVQIKITCSFVEGMLSVAVQHWLL